jgi:hypothetical protein
MSLDSCSLLSVCLPSDHKQLYLARLEDAVRKKWPELWGKQIWMLHHDSAMALVPFLILNYLAELQTTVVPHPPYSPD